MNLIERATNITLRPATEWQVIESETTTTADLFKNYIVPLAAIPALASFIGLSLFGLSVPFFGTIHTPLVLNLTNAIVGFVLGLIGTYLISLIANALAPSFGGEKNPMQALKVVAYAFTPMWVAGILNLLPSLSMLGLLAGLYGIYVLYLGLPVLMKTTQDKAVGYTAVLIICSIVVFLIVGVVVGAVGGLVGGGASAFSSAMSTRTGASSETSTAVAQWAKSMEVAGKAAEQAQKTGDAQAQASANAAVIGAAMGGGNVEVLDIAKIKPLLPETVANLKRTRYEGEKTAMGEFKISKAEAEYSDEANRNITLSVSDLGGNKAFAAVFGWGMIEQDKETNDGYEKMGKVDGRPTHERFNKNDNSGEYSVLVGDRSLVEAHGRNVDMATLKSSAAALDFGKLEAMKNEGVKQ